MSDRRYTVYIGFRIYAPKSATAPRGAQYVGSIKVHGWTLEEVKGIVERFKREFEREVERERAERAGNPALLSHQADDEVRR